MKKLQLWDRQIPATIIRKPIMIRGGMPGVYIWYLNQHFIDSVVYVGQSANVPERLYDEYRAPGGFISKWMSEKMQQVPIYCDEYSDPIIYGSILKMGKCDCLPRLRVKMILCENEDDILGLDELEKYLIRELNPALNKLRYADATL